jgi:sorbitol/mannitol transport system permease protein
MAQQGIVGHSRWSIRVAGLLAWAMALLFFFPVFWMVLTSFKKETSAQTEVPNFNLDGGLEQFREVTKDIGSLSFVEALGHSAFIVIVSTICVLILAIPAAYALTIQPVEKWRDVLVFFISTKFLPIAAAIVPIYSIFNILKRLDTLSGMVVMYTAMNLPLAIWMLRSFFADVPRELIEAAEIDGAGFFQRVRTVLLPIVMPGVSATALLCFIFAWNEYFLAVNLTTTDAATMPIWVSSFKGTRGLFLAKLSAASTLACLPVIIAGWVAQKRLVRGLTMGAIK